MPCQITTSSIITSLHYPRFNKARGGSKLLWGVVIDDDDDDDDDDGGAKDK